MPLSVKGRIALEILEAMVYLSENKIIHKDIKPENILVDQDFHIKVFPASQPLEVPRYLHLHTFTPSHLPPPRSQIADLGLAVSQAWSKLTKEESCRKSHSRQMTRERGAGTLSYMAPEHLESIHATSTEKSDVYSFAIVLWVILAGVEPYASEWERGTATSLSSSRCSRRHLVSLLRCQERRPNLSVRQKGRPTSRGPHS